MFYNMFTTTCFGPFLWAIFRLYTLGLESNVSYIQIYYINVVYLYVGYITLKA